MLSWELNAIYHELAFWKGFVKTRRFLEGWVGVGKTPELQQFVADFILSQVHRKVLDVGSGAVSILNGLIRQSDLTAIDPLGDLYRFIFDYELYKMNVPVALAAEELLSEGEYDIVHMSNAIDHVQDPHKVYQRLLRAVKPGGYLIIQGFEHEGQHEGYRGFHQWDFFVVDERLFVNASVLGESPYLVKKIKTEQNRDWYIWIVRK